ncbi:MAG: DUF4249 domain-containing protein [Bacteroidota bacterium]|nr:DUF4249 domain-containing protein [Bacteroidota bacterium]
MRLRKYLILFFIIELFATGCKIEYRPSVQSPATGYLVVEGFINSNGPTTITLSRTIKIYNDSVSDNREHNALVNIEGQNNESFPLYETGDGIYTSDSLPLNSNEKYRLKIKTADGKEYASDYSGYRTTQDIDSLSWTRNSDGVKIYINTHDNQNTTGYYDWKYEETWEFHAAYYSSLEFIVDPVSHLVTGVKYKNADKSIDSSLHTCWKTVNSSNIIIGSSTMLSSNHIYFPIMTIPSADEKLGVLYSIKVKQYAISAEAYSYLQKLKKNTEDIGSIFAAQPSQLTGNIHCTTNPSETAIGFVEVSQEKQERLFISNKQVPEWNYNDGCAETLLQNNPAELKDKAGGLFPTVPFEVTYVSIVSFYATPDNNCLDCTFRGSNVKPAFWP